MYSEINYKTKKEFRLAVEGGKEVRIFQPGGMFNPPEASPDFTGQACVEGPHYPKPHSWYATVNVESGVVKKVK